MIAETLVKLRRPNSIVVVVIVVIAGILLVTVWLTASRVRDSVFDKIEQSKVEQIQVEESKAAVHEANSRALIAEVATLKGQVVELEGKIVVTSNKIITTERSRKYAEKELQDNLSAIDPTTSVTDRCKRVCDLSKSLGLLPESADCGCK